MTFDDAYDMLDKHLRNSLDDSDYEGFSHALEIVSSSRDAEVAGLRLQAALSSVAIESCEAENDQLREQVTLLQDALEHAVLYVPDLGTVPGISQALAATEPR